MPHFGCERGIKLVCLYPKTLASENTLEILKDKRMMRKQADPKMALRRLFALHTGNVPDLTGGCK